MLAWMMRDTDVCWRIQVFFALIHFLAILFDLKNILPFLIGQWGFNSIEKLLRENVFILNLFLNL